MKLDNLLLLAGGGYILYSYMQKKNAETIKTDTLSNNSVEVLGCMNEDATNYNPLANTPFGDSLEGCIFESDSDGSLGSSPTGDLPIIIGCLDGMATNYNPMATEDDGSCYYPEIPQIGGEEL